MWLQKMCVSQRMCVCVGRPFNEEFLEFALHYFGETARAFEYVHPAVTFLYTSNNRTSQSVTPKITRLDLHRRILTGIRPLFLVKY